MQPSAVVGSVIVAFFLALWVYALWDIAQRDVDEFPSQRPSERLGWILVVLFFSGLGALAYWVMIMRQYPRRR